MISEKLFFDVSLYISENYIEPVAETFYAAAVSDADISCDSAAFEMPKFLRANRAEKMAAGGAMPCAAVPMSSDDFDDLDQKLRMKDESFKDMLLRKIDEAGITDAQCYKSALISRSHFNKIKLNDDYRVQKATVLSFVLALKLPLDEASEMLTKAGYAFSPSDKRDLIVRFCLERGIYDVMQVNEILLRFDQQLLGGTQRE